MSAFRAVQDAMIDLDGAWTNALERSGMHAIWGDMIVSSTAFPSPM